MPLFSLFYIVSNFLITQLTLWLSYRQRAAIMNGQEVDKESRGPKETRAVPAPDANAELVTSMQVPARLVRSY